MRTLHGSDLGLTLRKLSEHATNRVILISPYIGRWPAISALLGSNWWLGSLVTLHIITDINELSQTNQGTLLRFADRGLIKTIPGLHAKIYIIDNQAIITSANLTETAFTKRREIGIHLNETEATDTITIAETWWNNIATNVPTTTITDWEKQATSPFAQEDNNGQHLPTLWGLPPTPPDTLFHPPERGGRTFGTYQTFLKHYQELATIYAGIQRCWNNAPLFLETDAFLNYLFHDAEGTPAHEYYDQTQPRRLNTKERQQEISTAAASFAKWLAKNPNHRWRETHAATIQALLNKEHLDDLTVQEAKTVVDCLNCMNARQLNKYKFLKTENNTIENIRDAWKHLLHDNGPEQERMRTCNNALRFFGPSSVQELLGWYYPNKYPIRNNNSDAGLRYFGYNV